MRTAEQLAAEAARYTTTITRAVTDRIAECERQHALNHHVTLGSAALRAAIAAVREARRELIATAIRQAFLDGAAAAREGTVAARTGVYYSLGYSATRDLRFAASESRDHVGAPTAIGLAAELAAIERLENGVAELADVKLLEPLAELAGLPWRELFPELTPGGDA